MGTQVCICVEDNWAVAFLAARYGIEFSGQDWHQLSKNEQEKRSVAMKQTLEAFHKAVMEAQGLSEL